MKLLFLGTGAAQNALTPESQIEEGARRGSTLLIDINLLVDVSIQSFDFAEKLGADTSAVTDILITHTHEDHYSPGSLMNFAAIAKTRLNLLPQRRRRASSSFGRASAKDHRPSPRGRGYI